MLVVKLWPRIYIRPEFARVDALYHYWKISVVSLKMIYWSVTRNRIRAISCDWEQEVELVLHLLEAPEHLGERQPLCYLHPSFWSKRWEDRKVCNMPPPHQKEECFPAFISLLASSR